MIIDINQLKITIGDEYKIFVDEAEMYYASKKLLSVFPEITLIENGNDIPRLIIDRIPTWFKPKYDIKLWDKNTINYTTKSFWKNHFQCQAIDGLYDIYGHKGLKYSIFKNDRQVAWWDKNPVSWFSGDNYKIIADDNCDFELIIGFCLIHDNSSRTSNDSQMINIDIGNIGPQARKFDKDWKPNTILAQ